MNKTASTDNNMFSFLARKFKSMKKARHASIFGAKIQIHDIFCKIFFRQKVMACFSVLYAIFFCVQNAIFSRALQSILISKNCVRYFSFTKTKILKKKPHHSFY